MRESLDESAGERPNFAGHFILADCGCGTLCHDPAIVDATTGRVCFLHDFDEYAPATYTFRLDSRLLIVNPPEDGPGIDGGTETPDWYLPEYWVWDGTRFHRLR
jgi:hypothetical protein